MRRMGDASKYDVGSELYSQVGRCDVGKLGRLIKRALWDGLRRLGSLELFLCGDHLHDHRFLI